MKDVYERLKSYEPLWESWYVDAYIGKGSTSTVYKLKDYISDEICSAVKVISIEASNEHGYDFESKMKSVEDKKVRAEREIMNMYALNSCPYVVHCNNYAVKKIYDTDGTKVGYDILIRMGYYESFSKQLYKNKTVLSEDNIVKLAVDIGNGLKAAHDVNMMHRDIKPENFFINDKGDYLLGDLGVSKQISNETSYSTMTGTQPYIAPEIWKVSQTRTYTKTSDIYSFGIVLYTLLNNNCFPLTNEKSNANEIQFAIDKRLAGEPFPEPANGSKDLKRIVMKACQYNSKDRYQSMDELLADLDSLKSEDTAKKEPIETKNTSKYEQYKTVFADKEKDINKTVWVDKEIRKKFIIALCIGALAFLIAIVIAIANLTDDDSDVEYGSSSNLPMSSKIMNRKSKVKTSQESQTKSSIKSNKTAEATTSKKNSNILYTDDYLAIYEEPENSNQDIHNDYTTTTTIRQQTTSQDIYNNYTTTTTIRQQTTSKTITTFDRNIATYEVIYEISKEATVDHADIYSEDTGYIYYTVYTTDGYVYSVSYNKATGSIYKNKF